MRRCCISCVKCSMALFNCFVVFLHKLKTDARTEQSHVNSLLWTRNWAVADKPARRICTICNGVADPLKHAPLHMCYHAEFGPSMSKGVNINRGNPKIGERWGSAPWDGRRGWPQETCPSPCVLSCWTWSFCVKR